MDNLTQGLAIPGDAMQFTTHSGHGPPIRKTYRKTMGRIGQGLRSLLS